MATVYGLVNDEANAREKFTEARAQAETAVAESPNDGPRHALLGLVYAGLQRCREAAAEGDRAVKLLPETRDAFDGPILAVTRARIAVACGDKATAFALLERSVAIPAGITANELRRDPTWDPLRNDLRFKRLLTK
jgi:cytochrome c-type biogenesis protein CcmH/NrfG